ncbi:hypothetical protein LAZ67_14002784 [Cordylochernes scorpioides]|uniref:Uncharacterized protein n=1 Tax=Cordylochernes scorpioides TaxID=51811 RepID=A0ABY6L7K2_9ARAC|nr:hypothetical protein LAZ67_14002784 [Cordylochernes scorpioides]
MQGILQEKQKQRCYPAHTVITPQLRSQVFYYTSECVGLPLTFQFGSVSILAWLAQSSLNNNYTFLTQKYPASRYSVLSISLFYDGVKLQLKKHTKHMTGLNFM